MRTRQSWLAHWRPGLTSLLLLLPATLLSVQPARAALVLRLSALSGAGPNNPIEFTDIDGNGVITTGEIAVGPNWTVNITTGKSKPLLGGPLFAHMDIGSSNTATSGTADELLIELSDTDFNAVPAGVMTEEVGGTITGPAGSFVEFQAWKDLDNQLFGRGDVGDPASNGPGLITPGMLGPFFVVDSPYAQELSILHGELPTYSMTLVGRLVAMPGGLTDVSFNYLVTNVVPEPSSMICWTVLSMAGVALCVARRRRAAGQGTFPA